MNKNLFRIIFNKRRGQLIAVAEASSSQGKGARGEAMTFQRLAISESAMVTIGAIGFAVLCAVGGVLLVLPTQVAHAQVVAYRQAPGNQQPTILQTANSVPQVNIQTPSAAGVSRNVYSQFDVERKGVILNNSHENVKTQQGGWVQANPWLATGSARVILNEVNASNPSQLNGYVEVAGQRAEVVIANPSGISVNGGGFINTSKATLTTGSPILNGGSLEGYRVQAGNISINGKGLDFSTTDYAAILARAVQVNAGIWASELKVLTGANQIDAASLAANTTPIATTIAGTGVVPSFALDVAQIGGMYAGKIHLIGTEQGLGVRSAGTIGSTGGDLVLQNNGWLTSTGALQASANLQITTQGDITNSGTLYASNDQTLSATGSVTNSGFIAAQGNTSITANSFSSIEKSVVAAGLKTDGTLASSATSQSNLNINTNQDLIATGQNLAAGNISLTASSVDLSGSQTGAANIAISANAGSVTTANATVATSGTTGVLGITAKTNNDQTLDNTHGVLSAGQLNLDVANLNNAQGQIAQTGVGDTSIVLTSAASTFNNTGGTLTVNSAKLSIAANALANTEGKIQHAGTSTLSVTADTLNNVKGQIASNNNAELAIATQLNNTDGAITAGSLNLNVGNLDNTKGSMYAHSDLSLVSTGAIANTGFIAAQGNATLSANSLSSSSASVLGAGIKADGTLASSGDLKITTTQTLSATGQNLASGSTTFSGSSVQLSGSQTGGANIGITATSGDINTTSATVATVGTLSIAAKTNTSQTLNNTQGVLSANQLNIDIANLNNAQGQITQTGTSDTTITLTSPTSTLNNTGGTINTNSANLSLSANTLANTDGKIQHAGTGTLYITAATFNDQQGEIVSNNALRINAGQLDHRSARTSAKNITLAATNLNNSLGELVQTGNDALAIIITQGLDNTEGTLASNGKLTVAALSLNNNLGQVSALGDLTVNLNTARTAGSSQSDGALSNLKGLVAANGDVTITAASVDNTLGTLASVDKNLSVTTTGVTTNDSGKIQAALDIALNNAGLSNTRTTSALATSSTPFGSIVGRNIDIDTNEQTLSNAGGTLAASLKANLQTGTLDNNGGLIQTGSDLAINTHGQTLTNTNAADYTSNNTALNGKGGIAAQGTSTFTTGDLNNGAGYIGSQGALMAKSANIINTLGGQIQGLDNLALSVGTGTINNTAGLIRSSATTSLSAGKVTNSNTLSATNPNLGIEGNDVATTTATLNNDSGAIRADNNISVTSAGTVDNSKGLMSAANTLTLQDVQTQNNRTLTITNTDATLLAGQSLTVAANGIGGNGSILSKGDLNLALNADFTNSGKVIANSNATINTTGNVNNSGKLQAGNTLNLTGNNIDNTATGEISTSTTQVNAKNTLANRGLIDGVETQINATTVRNIGTGRIYGDHLSIAAVNLTNDTETIAGVTKAGTIAARDRLDLGISGTLTNREHALIYSVGDMSIGGALDANRLATGSATTVNNNSATIETGGNLYLSSATVNNTNDHFATRVDHVVGPTVKNWLQGEWHNDHQTYTYNTVANEYETKVTKSDSAQILAAGNIQLKGENIINDKSKIIAGGSLTGDLDNLSNIQATGEHRITESGTVTMTTHRWEGGIFGRGDYWEDQTTAYTPADVVTSITLPVTYAQENTAPSLSDTQVASLKNSTVSQTIGIVGNADARSVSIAPVNVSAQEVSAVSVNKANGASTSSTTLAGQTTTPSLSVRTVHPNTTLSTTSLYKTNPAADTLYLVETDPRFTNNKTWLGSDYIAKSLSMDPAVTQKRLGDGFYEQKLIREQVAELTGRRFLANYTSDEQEYKALMDSGITFAKQYNLRLGIALTAQQIAQLTSDIVWLVEQTVTLPDGSSQKVLVPQVYVKIQPGDLDGSGALLAGKDINLNLSGDLTNSGTIAGRNVVNLTAENVNNLGGRMTGNDVSLAARQDLNNIGGSISAVNSLSATAGRDLNIETMTQSTRTAMSSSTRIDRVAGLYVSGTNGTLVANAGRDLNIVAGVVSNAGSGTTSLSAGNNVTLATVKTSDQLNIVWDANNYNKSSNDTDVGSFITGGGNTNFKAGQTFQATAANVQAAGALTVNATDVHIQSGQSKQASDEARQTTTKGFLSSSTVTTRETRNSTTALGSNLGGRTVEINAGNDIAIKGSNVLSDNDLSMTAANNITIEAAQNTNSSSSFRQETNSGLMSGGGLSISYGKQKQSVDGKDTTTTAAASTVGSVGGNVNIKAGGQYKQTGSDVLAPKGDIDITAKTVDIKEARESNRQSSEQKFEQTAISVGLKDGIIDTVQATTQAVQAAKDSSSNRNRNLNALVAYGKGSDAYEQGKATQSAYDKNGVMGDTGADGKPAPGAAAASGIKVSISIGSSKSQSNSSTTSNTSAASTVKAGGNVSIKATGQNQGEGNLTIQGSNVSAAKDVSLSATKNVNILASADTESNRSTNSSSSTSVGLSMGIGQGGAGLSLDVAASRGKGQANSDSITYNNSHITGSNQVTIISGTDTNVVGSNIKANQVTANVGGNLNIESLQDTATSQASQKTTGIALSIPIVGTGGSASFSQNKQKSESNYASVNEQSGIKADEGGFTINVKGNTDLKGAVIASSYKAVQDGKNTISTNTLTTSDISNSMSASASSRGVSVGTSMMDGNYAMGKALVGNAINNGSANQNDAGTTAGAISAAQVTVGNKTTDTSKEQLKDSNGKTVSTDTRNTNRTLAKADVASLQKSAQDQQAGNMLAFKAATAFTDEAYRTMYKAGAQLYKVPPGCSDKSCAVPLTEPEAKNLKTSQDGQLHISNNGIFNDLDGAVKYAQQHGGTTNPDGSKDYTTKPENQYIIFAPQANNVLSELIIAGIQKSGTTPYVGLTNAEEQTAKIVQHAMQKGQGVVIDSHSRGALTTDNALQSLNNQGGLNDAAGNIVTTNVQLNNYGGAQNNATGNQTLQQLTGNKDAQINSVVHPNDFIGTVIGGNQATPSYTGTTANGTKAEVKSTSEGKDPVSNIVNTMTGTTTPHNCYGTASKDCGTQWQNILESNSPNRTNPDYRAPVVIPQYQQVDKVTPQMQQDTNKQMNQLLRPIAPLTGPVVPITSSSSKLETLQNFKKEP